MADEEPEGIDLGPVLTRLEDEFRKVGLYVAHSAPFADEFGGRFILLDCTLGDIAFADRVQDPDKVRIDAEVAQFNKDMTRSDFERTRDELQRRLAAGESLFGETP